MNFNSYIFFALLIPVIILYRVLPWNIGKVMLVLASYVFYGYAEPFYLILLFYSSVIDYIGAIFIHDAKSEFRRKVWLWISVIGNIGLLLAFKYANFMINNINLFSDIIHFEPIKNTGWLLPAGISFYTFQTLSYTVDVYRKQAEPCRNFVTFALYVSYFPQLVAGPIERATHLIKQISEKHRVPAHDLMKGLERILWGLIKKCVLADRLALFINEVYANPEQMPAPVIWLVMIGFMMQLYLDFSAYTDIAIGLAQLMGVQLAENFKHPLIARNPVDFWNRWHITLTTWFRDYVFVTMGGLKRQQKWKSMFNIMVVFTLTGFWHGASWNFVLFGAYAGLGVAVYQYIKIFSRWRTTRPLLGKSIAGTSLAIFLYSVYMYVGGVFFRTPDIATAITIYKGALFNEWSMPSIYLPYAILIALIWLVHLLRENYFENNMLSTKLKQVPVWTVNLFYIVLLNYAAYEHKVTFIYFQF